VTENAKPPAKTAQERQADARAEKLARVEEQVAAGSLVIRQMTRAEQAKWAKRRGMLPLKAKRPKNDDSS
jgi:hypothetical protein